jgi:hypothetical protein
MALATALADVGDAAAARHDIAVIARAALHRARAAGMADQQVVAGRVLPLEVRGNRDGAHASHILSVDSQRFDGRVQLGTDEADILITDREQPSLMAGGRSSDRYRTKPGDVVFENRDEGEHDTVYTDYSASLPDNVEDTHAPSASFQTVRNDRFIGCCPLLRG